MKNQFPVARIRLIVFAFAAALHIIVIVFFAFKMESEVRSPMAVAGIMRLMDIEEQYNILPPAAQEITPGPPETETQEAIAEHMVETNTEPLPAVIGARTGPPGNYSGGEAINYLAQHQISVLPLLPEDKIVRATIYPPIAQRSNIEGVVYLELFIDRFGVVRDVRIIRENPPDRGFGAAAVNAFKGISGKPAEANGQAVAVRYRYNINFKLN